MKKIVCVFVLPMMLLLSGCSVGESLKEKTVVESIGIDYSNGEFSVTALTYKPQSPEAPSDQKTETVTASAKTLGEALSKLSDISGKDPFYDNNRIAVVSDDAVRQKLNEIIDFFIRDADMREDCYLLYCEKSAKDILSCEDLTKGDSNRLFTLLEKNVQGGGVAAVTVMEAASGLKLGLGDIYMPKVEVDKEKKIKISETVVFDKTRPVLTLDTEMGMALLLVNNQLERPIVTLDMDPQTAGVRILAVDTKIKPSNGSELQFDVQINAHCAISEASVNEDNISKGAEKYFKDIAARFLKLTATDQGIDAAGLIKKLRAKEPELFADAGDDKKSFIKNAKFNIEVKVQIMRNGRTP